eukprot:8769408-Pyramimonas_sp.AAC.1
MADQSDAGSAGIFSRQTISDAGSAGIFSRQTNSDAGSAGIFSRQTNRAHLAAQGGDFLGHGGPLAH